MVGWVLDVSVQHYASTKKKIFITIFIITKFLFIDPPTTPLQQQLQLYYHELSRDKRLRIRLFKELYWKYIIITEHEGVSIRQIFLAVNYIYATPQKHLCGAKPKLNYN